MEENKSKQSVLQYYLGLLKGRFFDMLLVLFKDRHISKLHASLLMLVLFIQLVGYLFSSNVYFE